MLVYAAVTVIGRTLVEVTATRLDMADAVEIRVQTAQFAGCRDRGRSQEG